MFGILTNYINSSFSTDNFTIFTNFFYRRSYIHTASFYL